MKNEIVIESAANDPGAVAILARKIWTQHYVPIIGTAQVNYMLAQFQSTPALSKQYEEGYVYFLVRCGMTAVGYFGLLPDKANKKLKISKFYLLAETRGQGIGGKMLDFIEAYAFDMDTPVLWLTVNKYNHGSIAWYLRRGFGIVDEVKEDIGSGYFMDDFVMEKALGLRQGFDS